MRCVVVLVLVAGLGACASGNATQTDAPPVGKSDAAIDSNGCTMQPCDILPQCGCNGNTACDIDLVDQSGTTCRSINLAGKETAACTNPNECDRGYVCLGGSAFASCKKYCSGDADCGAPRGKCIYSINSGGAPIAGVPNACSSNCEPTDTTAAECPSTMKCTLFSVNKDMMSVKVADCSPAGTLVQGGDCTAGGIGVEARCAKGYQCVKLGAETTFKCRRICSAPGTATGCAADTCRAFTEPHTIGPTTYGVCGP